MVDQTGDAGQLGVHERLDLLENAAVITARARTATQDLVPVIEDFVAAPLSDDHGAQLVTHVAMALTRLDRREESPEVPTAIGDEIAGRVDEWRFARECAAQWQLDYGLTLPESEVAYLVVHLSVLRERARLSE